jgi:uncharacterized membrane protein YhaH (DUF805 family)
VLLPVSLVLLTVLIHRLHLVYFLDLSNIAFFVVGLLVLPLVPAAAITVKRLHDRNWSWRLAAAIVLLIYLLIAVDDFSGYLQHGRLRWLNNAFDIYLAVLLPLFLVVTNVVPAIILFLSGAYDHAHNLMTSARTGQGLGATLPYVLRGSLHLTGAVACAWYLWEVGLRRGTVGPNRFGPDPESVIGAPA